MMVLLTEGVNTFGSIEAANAYFDTKVHQKRWTDLTTTLKKQGLVTAFHAMNQKPWAGSKTDTAQVGAFPRTGLEDSEGNALDSSVVPNAALYGQFEFALYLAEHGGFEKAAAGQIKEVQAGPAVVKYFAAEEGTTVAKPILPEEVTQYFDALEGRAEGGAGEYYSIALGTQTEGFFGNSSYDLT